MALRRLAPHLSPDQRHERIAADPVELSRTRSVAHVSTAHLGHALSDDQALLMRSHVAVFVVDGYDIDLYPDAEAAARTPSL